MTVLSKSRVTIAAGATAVLLGACAPSSPGAWQGDVASTKSSSTSSSLVVTTTQPFPTSSTSGMPTEPSVRLPEGYTGVRADALEEQLDLDTFAAIWTESAYVGIAESPDGSVVVAESVDGLTWSVARRPVLGLPAEIAGPFRLWRFGDGFMLYGTGDSDDDLLGPDTLVAVSPDMFTWEVVEMPGIDPLFYLDQSVPEGRGGVSGDGTIGVFIGFSLAFESDNPNHVVFAVRPGEKPAEPNGDTRIWSVAFLKGTVLGTAWNTESELHELYRLDESRWTVLPGPPASPGLVPILRSVGGNIVVENTLEYWLSSDESETWDLLDGPPSGVVMNGFFSDNGAAGPVQSEAGIPPFFHLTTDGLDWRRVPLPADAVSIRHLATSPDSLLSLVRLKGDGGQLLISVPLGRHGPN